MGGLPLNIGDSVIDALKANQTMGWQFTDTMDEATDGVYSSEYYAALIIPEDFSEKMISFLNGEVQNPQIIYYENEKKKCHCTKDYIQGKNGSAGTGKCNLCQHSGRSHVKGK